MLLKADTTLSLIGYINDRQPYWLFDERRENGTLCDKQNGWREIKKNDVWWLGIGQMTDALKVGNDWDVKKVTMGDPTD